MRRPGASRRAGVTLVELLVVLALVGLGTAVVLPAVRGPAPADGDDDPVAAARRLAIQRGETLRLVAVEGGRWALVRAAAPDDTVGRGHSPIAPGTALTLLPTGGCLPRALPGAAGAWDPLRCRASDGR